MFTFLLGSGTQINAQEKLSQVTNTFEITFEPPNDDHPQATKAGASRGNQCVTDTLEPQALTQHFTPLLPKSSYGLTLASHPTILAHIPVSSAEKIFLTLRDENEEEVYQTVLPIASKSGVIAINIPEEAPSLEVEQVYKWSFALMCDNDLRPDSPVVGGFIKRVQPEMPLIDKLTEANFRDKASLYGEAGIWYETISSLASLRKKEPLDDDLNYAWIQLLSNVGLENIANAEIVD